MYSVVLKKLVIRQLGCDDDCCFFFSFSLFHSSFFQTKHCFSRWSVDIPIQKSSAGIKSILSSSVASSMPLSLTSTMACMLSVKTFTLAELEKATDKFSSDRILGEGGFGRVYHGIMEDGSEAAVKLLRREDQSGDREFIVEVEMLSRLHHRNLVELIGICIEDHTRCLVYELVRNGSVESHLHGIFLSFFTSFIMDSCGLHHHHHHYYYLF